MDTPQIIDALADAAACCLARRAADPMAELALHAAGYDGRSLAMPYLDTLERLAADPAELPEHRALAAARLAALRR